MKPSVDREALDHALKGCGSSWTAEQVHGLLCSRLSVMGAAAGSDWLRLILDGDSGDAAPQSECAEILEKLFVETHQQLAERQSEFEPLLPDDEASAEDRARGLAFWCEGFLHGLVSDVQSTTLKERLAKEPLCDIIRDMLQMTRATAGDTGDEDNDQAFAELVEYLRVAVQLTYEELDGFRSSFNDESTEAESPPVLH